MGGRYDFPQAKRVQQANYMKKHLVVQTMRRAARGALLCGALLAMAVQTPVRVMGQSIYATPYTITTLAGLPGISGTNDGAGNAARFSGPNGAAVDGAGNLYVADTYNQTIRKVTPSGVVTTLAGLAGISGTNDGTGSAARFNFPWGVAVATNGNVFVADTYNDTIRELTPMGTNWAVTTLAGQAGIAGGMDGTNGGAQFDNPQGVAVDTNGNIYVADTYDETIRKVAPSGTNWVVTTLAGQAGVGGHSDGTNGGARFSIPQSVAVDGAGNLYVADFDSDTIRKVTPSGTNWVVTTIAGSASALPGSADGTNGAARFAEPGGVAVDRQGRVYVADTYNATIRLVTPSGTNWVVTTLAGLAEVQGTNDGTGSNARFNQPNGLAVDSAGNVYVADTANNTIRKGLSASSVPPPVLQSPGINAGQFGFGITGLPNLAVDVQSSGDLIHWQVVGTNYILVGGTNFFSSPSQPQGNGFYRVHVR
jgi:sugar lactone lactonase YvrE